MIPALFQPIDLPDTVEQAPAAGARRAEKLSTLAAIVHGGAGGRADRRADGDDLIRAEGGSCENASRDSDLNCRRHITTAVVEIANGNARARATVLERAAALCHH